MKTTIFCLIGALTIDGISTGRCDDNADTQGLAPAKPATSAQLTAVRAAVSPMLKDADSAKYQDVTFRFRDPQNGKLCGKVNAKNAFGGYVGFQTFLGDYENGKVSIRQMDTADAYAYAAGACHRLGM